MFSVLPGPDRPLLPLQPKITAILAPLTATAPLTDFFTLFHQFGDIFVDKYFS
jgi:hypothetical protein